MNNRRSARESRFRLAGLVRRTGVLTRAGKALFSAQHFGAVYLAIALTFPGPLSAAQKAIPYPDALSSASVRMTGINPSDAIGNLRSGLVVGNGEMNTIVYVSGPRLEIRVSKNDVWDGRIDTSEDPALPRVDPATHQLHREKAGNPPSWNKPYPCGLPSADICLEGLSGDQDWELSLDLEGAVATASTPVERAKIRVLSQANVIYIESRRKLRLQGIPQIFLPEATGGRNQANIQWLRQTIPGNQDISGMEVCLAAGAEGNRQVVAVVTSKDAVEPLDRAIELVRRILSEQHDKVLAKHEQGWSDFWARSGIRLEDKQLEGWWYRMVYLFRVFSKPGATAVGLKFNFDSLAGWHNSYKFNYNIQQTYLSAGPINHPELVEPIIDVLENYWPRARWFATNCFIGCEGAFVHSDVFHPQEPDPLKCTSKNRHQFAYIPWGYTLGMQGHISFLLWEYQQYKPDTAYLKRKTYPMLRDIGLFYCSFLEKCKRDERGKLVVGPSYFPENGYFGQDNGAYDLAYVPYGLKAARDAARLLERDKELVKRIDALLPLLPPFETLRDPVQENKPIVIWHKGAKFPDDDRHASLIQAVFPAGLVTWFSPQEDRDLFKRSINHVGKITTHANSPVTLNISRARLGMTDEALSNIAVDFTEHHKPQRNGLFNWKAHGNYISEQVGIARVITELLLQSVEGVIRVFPAWPAGKPAEFAGLRAQGGFLVSARMAGNQTTDVVIESTAGGVCSLTNPWPGIGIHVVGQRNGKTVRVQERDGIVRFESKQGEKYTIQKR